MFRYILISFFIFFNSAFANSNDEIINKLTKKFTSINNLQFNFIQKTEGISETGNCFLQYPKNLICRYDGNEGKEIVIKNNTLAIIKRKYKRVYPYRVSNSPFTTLLDKAKILDHIKSLENIENQNNQYIISFTNQNVSTIKLYIDQTTLNISGWETAGYDQQKVIFKVLNPQINIENKEKFEIPNYSNNLGN